MLRDQWGANNAGTDFTKVQERLTKTGYEKYIKDFLIQLLDKNKGGTEFFNKRLPEAIDPTILSNLKTKAQSEPIPLDIESAVKKYILPVNPETGEINNECMVEWALVLTPIYRFDAVAPFYYYPPGSNSMEYVSMSTCVALDAYWFAQWDQTSHALSAAGYYSGYEGATGVDVYIGVGLLSWWLGCTESVNNAGAPGIAAYCTKEGDHYLGVYTQHENISQYKWSRWLVDKPSEYAKRGGIAVFTTEITTPDAPVYYHTYTYRIDENDKENLPDGYTPGTYSGCLHNHIAVCFAKPTNCNNSNCFCVLTN